MLFKELGYAVRQLRRAPGFALLAILTLAIGIGASTAIFTVVDSVLLSPLPYPDSGRLVMAWERVKFLGPKFPQVGPNPRHEDLWQKRSTAFSRLTMFQTESEGVAVGSGHPEPTGAISAYANFLSVLQVNPLLGRSFRPEEAIKGRDNVAIITYDVWHKLFGGDPNVLGKSVMIGQVAHEVVGVLPRDFRFPRQSTLTRPKSASYSRSPSIWRSTTGMASTATMRFSAA